MTKQRRTAPPPKNISPREAHKVFERYWEESTDEEILRDIEKYAPGLLDYPAPKTEWVVRNLRRLAHDICSYFSK